MKPFERWKYEEIELTFGTERDDTLVVLSDWLSANEVANDFEMQTLSNVHAQLVRKVEAWNEDELKFFFIAHVVNLVNFSKPKVYSSFSQRTLSAVKKDIHQNDVELRGRIEFFVALGEQIPRQPFFFLHEYKPLNKTTPSDPLGQLLIAMLATQTFNEIKRPLYGTFVRGSDWQFVVLDGNKYAVSSDFDSKKIDDLLKIFAILKKCKEYIESWVS
jgi:hypothetical protein